MWFGAEAKIISLLELMEEYKVDNLAKFLGSLVTARVRIQADIAKDPDLTATEEYCKNLGVVLEWAGIVCDNFDADPSLAEQISNFSAELRNGKADRRGCVVTARLDMLIKGIQNHLSRRTFMYIPQDEAAYWENIKLFGEYFALDFPKPAIFEALEAGNCFAAGRGTACVFHCMRVAEYGLRKLGRNLHVKLTHGGKTLPIEYADWNNVITEIRNKISVIRHSPKGPKQERALEFYSNAADHCEYMKDIWRNQVAHPRRLYNKAETQGVVSRVRDLLLIV